MKRLLLASWAASGFLFVAHAQADTSLVQTLVRGEHLKEAVVRASRPVQTGKLVLGKNVILSTPSVLSEPDVLKTLQLFPGVQSGMEGTSGILVRGGGADENLFLVDGVPVYNTSHLLGIFSAFTPEAVKRVTFYKGAFPARYGGRVSSVVDIQTSEGDLNRFHATLCLGLLNSRLHVEGPIVKGKTSFSFSARGMNSIIATPVMNAIGSQYNLFFYDLNGKIVHYFSDRDALMLTFYKGRDHFSFLSDESLVEEDRKRYIEQEGMKMSWGNILATAKWNHVQGDRLFITSSLSWYGYDMSSTVQRWETTPDVKSEENSAFSTDIRDLIIRADIDFVLSPNQCLHGGLTGTRHVYSPLIKVRELKDINEQEDTPATEDSYKGWEIAGYLEDEITIGNRLTVNAGLRYTVMPVQDACYRSLQPRFSAKFYLPHDYVLTGGYGRVVQYVHLLSTTQASLPTDIWVPVTKDIRPVISDQVSMGVSRLWDQGWELTAEGYYKYSENVLEYRNGVSFQTGFHDFGEMVSMGQARSFGLEVLLRKNTGKTTGWFGYTLSKSERRFPDGSLQNSEWFPYHYDRRHTLVLNVNHRFNDRWDVGATWSFESGYKITVPTRMILTMGLTREKTVTGYILTSFSKNNYTLPSSHRLNITVNWHRSFRRCRRTLSLGGYNIYNAMNPNLVMAKFTHDKRFVINSITYLPILPSLSYSLSF